MLILLSGMFIALDVAPLFYFGYFSQNRFF